MDTKRKINRIGEIHMANCGMKMTIIEYHNNSNIVVQFQDGYIKQTTYRQFINGKVKNPNYEINHIGETHMANCGILMTIIEYHNANDIIIKFQDGYIKQTNYDSFIKGKVRNPNYKRKNEQRKKEYRERYEGKSKIMKNGLSLKVIEYRDCDHMLCKWDIDESQIVISSYLFNLGTAKHPSINVKSNRKKKSNMNSKNLK